MDQEFILKAKEKEENARECGEKNFTGATTYRAQRVLRRNLFSLRVCAFVAAAAYVHTSFFLTTKILVFGW